MDAELAVHLAAIFVLILANGFFALSEFSIIASRRSRLEQKMAQGKRGAATAARLHKHPDKFLATIQVGITLVGTMAGVFGGATVVDEVSELLRRSPLDFVVSAAIPIAVALVAIVITITSVVLGELVPKYLALSNPEFYARQVARPINLFIKLTSFFSNLLSNAAHLIISILGVKHETGRAAVTEEEINLMIFEGKEKGIFDETEERLVKSVFDFADMTVRRAMTPRTEVVGIESNADPKQVLDIIINDGYSRYPIYEKTIDNIVGIVYTKDIIFHKLSPELIIIKDLIRKPLFVPDSMPLSKLLSVFQKKKQHLAVVLDEFGGTAGIITLEDLLEELVGDIQDEYDTDPIPLVKHSETTAFAAGTVWPGEINDVMKCRLPEDKAETLAGLVFDHLGRLPGKNERVTIADMVITVLEQDENRLVRLKLEKIADKKARPEN